jgi:hypothetical protein
MTTAAAMSIPQMLPTPGVEQPSKMETPELLITESDCPRDGYASYTDLDEDVFEDFTDAEEQFVIEEAIALNAKEVHKQEINIAPPVIPQRNRLRASRLLTNLKLDTMETARQSITTSHDVYMSSEEDASSSADDFSDYGYDSDSESDSEVPEGSPARRKSREDTARAVSVVFVGRPSVVELSKAWVPPRGPASMSQAVPLERPISCIDHPPHRSSLAPTALALSRPAFLNTDPFAVSKSTSDASRDHLVSPASQSPLTPTKVLHRFSKSLSLARKRSRPNLREDSASDRTEPPLPTSESTLKLIIDDVDDHSPTETENEAQLMTPITPQTSVTYREILRIARKNSMASMQIETQHHQSQEVLTPSQPQTPQPQTPSTPGSSRRFLGGFRRRSIKARSVTFS